MFLFGTKSSLGVSQDGKTDSVLVTSVSDTLNVIGYSFDNWISKIQPRTKLNVVHGLHDYRPAYDQTITRNDLGNIGSADFPVLFDLDQPFGFNFRQARRVYWKSMGEREVLVSPKMFSNVDYVNGAERENDLEANFTRGFGDLLDLGFCFKRISSLGFYDRQSTVFTDFSIYGLFKTKNNRYRLSVIFDYSNLNVEENGGIAVDSIFEQNLTTGRNFIPINLSTASNHWKGFDIGLNQRFILVNPSDTTLKKKYFLPSLSHSFAVERHSMIYEDVPDTTSDFYENILLDTISTLDSTYLLSVRNKFWFELIKSDSVKPKLVNEIRAGIGHDYHQVTYDSISRRINNLSVLASAGGTLGEFGWLADARVMVVGYNIGDMKISANVHYNIGKSIFGASVRYSLFRPDEISTNYLSNHFAWSNSWSQTSHLRTEFNYTQTRLRFNGAVQYHVIDKMVVFGTVKQPYQANDVNQLLVVKVNEHFRLRWFHIMLEGAIQFKLSGDEIRVPMALGRGMLYYQNDLFKRRLRLQIGIEASYSTAYFANAYNPALSAFYLQNEKKIGNYPYLDFFLNLRVKKFKAFVKVEHVNAGWLGYNYYQLPHYPANDLAWKFGINWAFLD